MAVAVLQVVAHARCFLEIMSVVARGHPHRGLVACPCLIYIVDDLIPRSCFGESAGLCFVAGALFLALVAIKETQRDADLKAGAVESADALVFAADGGIRGAFC